MVPFDKHDLRICVLKCTELIATLRAYPDLYPIQDGANQVLSALFRVIVRTVPQNTEIHTLSLDDSNALRKTLKTCISLLVELSKIFTAYAPIDALYLDEKTKLVILDEVVCRYALRADLRLLAMAVLAPHIAMDHNDRKDKWTLSLDQVRCDRDAILRRLGSIREMIEVYSPGSNFRQSLGSMHSTARVKGTGKKIDQLSGNSLGERTEHSAEAPSSDDTACRSKLAEAFHESEQTVYLRAALRTCAPEHGAYISLDKEADDALREAAISKIAGSLASHRPSLNQEAQDETFAVSSAKSESAIGISSAVDIEKSSKADFACAHIHTNLLDDMMNQETSVPNGPVQCTKLGSDVIQQSDKCTRNTTGGDDMKGFAEPLSRRSKATDLDTVSCQQLPVLLEPALRYGGLKSESDGPSLDSPINNCSWKCLDSEDVVDLAEANHSSHGKNTSSDASSPSLPTCKIAKNFMKPWSMHDIVASRLRGISLSNARFTAVQISKETQLSREFFKKQHSHRAPLILQDIFTAACRDSGRAAAYALCLGRLVDLVSPEIRDETMKDRHGVSLSGSRLLCAYLKNMCQEFSIQPLSEPDAQLGFAQFLGQLYIQNHVLNEAVVYHCINRWLNPGDSMFNIGRLYHLLQIVGKRMDTTTLGPILMNSQFEVIKNLATAPETSEPVMKVLYSLIAMRDSQWLDKGPQESTFLSSLIKREVDKEFVRK